MKSGAVVVLYEPEASTFDNVVLLNNQFDCLIVVDNSEVSSDVFNQFTYMHNKNIDGLAGALNLGIGIAFERMGCDIVYSFDQDTIIPNNFLREMNSMISGIKDREFVICPNFFDINSRSYAKFINLNKYSYSISDSERSDFCITSGMGITSGAWTRAGDLDKRLVIDHVDTEYCLRLKLANIPIYVNKSVCLQHSIGKRNKHYIFGVEFKPNNHNHIRRYYIVRNGTYISFVYFRSLPSYFLLNIMRLVHEFVCVVIYEENKFKKLNSMSRGIFDAVIGKLGQYK